MTENRCCTCGSVIPEGRQVCLICEKTNECRGNIETEKHGEENYTVCKKKQKMKLFSSSGTKRDSLKRTKNHHC